MSRPKSGSPWSSADFPFLPLPLSLYSSLSLPSSPSAPSPSLLADPPLSALLSSPVPPSSCSIGISPTPTRSTRSTSLVSRLSTRRSARRRGNGSKSSALRCSARMLADRCAPLFLRFAGWNRAVNRSMAWKSEPSRSDPLPFDAELTFASFCSQPTLATAEGNEGSETKQ